MTPQDDDVDAGGRAAGDVALPGVEAHDRHVAGSVTHFILAFVALWSSPSSSACPTRRCRDRRRAARRSRRSSTRRRLRRSPTTAEPRRARPADPASPAARPPGCSDGDKITAVNGTPVATYGDMLTDAIRALRRAPTHDHLRPRRRRPAPRTVNLAAVAAARRWTTRTARSTAGRGGRRRLGLDRRAADRSRTARSTAFGATADYTGDHGQRHRSRRCKRIPEKVPALWTRDHRRRARPGHPDQRGRRQPARRRGGRGAASGQLFLLLFVVAELLHRHLQPAAAAAAGRRPHRDRLVREGPVLDLRAAAASPTPAGSTTPS